MGGEGWGGVRGENKLYLSLSWYTIHHPIDVAAVSSRGIMR